jgi:hypothetical protein
MTMCIEIARFRVNEPSVAALLAERPAMIDALKRRFPSLRHAYLARDDDGTWLDMILWSSREEALNAAANVHSIPECANWFRHISESLGLRHVEVAHAFQP